MEDQPQQLPEAWRRELRRGLRSLRAGEFERAESHFARAHRWAPDRPEVCYALGRERLRRGETSQAEALLRAAWEGDRSLVSAAATLARCLALHMQRFDDALAVLVEIERQHGPLALVAVVRSEILLEQGSLDAARRAARDALEACDREGESQAGTATAREAARAALARVENQEGIDLADSGDSEAALFRFKRAADLDPSWSSPHVNMGATFAGMGKLQRARECYQTAVDVDPHNPLGYYNLGLLLKDFGDLGLARTALEIACELDGSLAEARTALAEICLELGDVDRAVTELATIVDECPEDSHAWVNLGAALSSRDDLKGAEAAWRRALQIDPCHVGACCRLADLLTRDARYLEAAILARRAQEIDAAQAQQFFTARPSPTESK